MVRPRNLAEEKFGKNMAPTARIYNNAEFASRVEIVQMGLNSFIGDFCFISVPTLVLGDGAQINSGSRIVGREPVTLGDFATVSYGCTLITTTDSSEAPYMNDAAPNNKRILRSAPIFIGERSFIGAHSVIMPGVGTAKAVVVRAFSYVNKPLVIPQAIYGGQPAIYRRDRSYFD